MASDKFSVTHYGNKQYLCGIANVSHVIATATDYCTPVGLVVGDCKVLVVVAGGGGGLSGVQVSSDAYQKDWVKAVNFDSALIHSALLG